MKINKLIKDINNYYLKKLMKKEQVFYQIEDDYILLSDKYIIAILKRDEFNYEEVICDFVATIYDFINKVIGDVKE